MKITNKAIAAVGAALILMLILIVGSFGHDQEMRDRSYTGITPIFAPVGLISETSSISFTAPTSSKPIPVKAPYVPTATATH